MNTSVIIITAVVCIAGVFAYSKSRAQKPGGADPAIYPKMRDQALSVSRAKLGLPPSSAPLAVIMDVRDTDGSSYTTVAFEDGTASIYLSSGGGSIGGSQKHESIKNAGLGMLRTAASTLGSMAIVKSYPLPDKGHTSFFVVTDAGTYSITVRTVDVEGPKHPLNGLYATGQDVVTQYRLSQTK